MKIVTRHILVFSFFILLIAGSYSSFSSLLSYIHKEHGEQHNQHASLYFVLNSVTSIVFNILIPNIKITSIKKLAYFVPVSFLLLYLLTYFGFLSMSSTWALIFTAIGSIFGGIGSSLVWIISGKFVKNVCKIYKVQLEQGKYFGIFGAIMAFSFFIGAILSVVFLQTLDKKHDLYLVLTLLGFVGIIYCKYLIPDLQREVSLLNVQEMNQNTNRQDEIQQKNVQVQENKPWISADIKCDKTCLFKNLSVYRKMSPLIPFQILNGIMVGYIYHCSQDLVFAPQKTMKDTFFTINLCSIGLGGSLGAYCSGYLGDRLDSKKITYIGVMTCIVSFFMGIISLYAQIQLISLITSFMSGFSMMYTNNMLVVMSSKDYQGTIDNFAANRQMINLSFLLYNVGISFVGRQNMHRQMYYQLALFIVLGLVSLYFVQYIRSKQSDSDYSNNSKDLTEQPKQVQLKLDFGVKQAQKDLSQVYNTQKSDRLQKS